MRILTYEFHRERGAEFEDFFGCEIPSHYGNYEQEYWTLRKSVGVRDVSYFGKVHAGGKDSRRFLNAMLSSEVKSLEPGQGTYALLLDMKGHIQADMKIYAFADHFLMVLQHYAREKVVSGLDRYIISEVVTMKDVTEELAMFQIIGPQADSFLQSKGMREIPSTLYSYRTVQTAGVEAWLIRLGSGYALLCPAKAGVSVLNHFDAQMVGRKAFDVFRIELGLPLLLRDFDDTNFAQECRLEQALDFRKGCYLGQEVMARIDAQGHVNKVLMGIASSSPLKEGDKVFKSEKEIGKITSSTFSFYLNQPLALGYVRREHAVEGVTVEGGANHTTAIVKQLPLKLRTED